jgi:hypothetical protein
MVTIAALTNLRSHARAPGKAASPPGAGSSHTRTDISIGQLNINILAAFQQA